VNVPSRNVPCPCGSGKRYKDCHGAIAAGGVSRSVAEVMQTALAAQLAGDFIAAATLYRQVLAREPRNFDAIHMLGVVHFQRFDFVEAERLIRMACELDPKSADATRNLRLAVNAQRMGRNAVAYGQWLARNEPAENSAREGIREAAASAPGAPLVAVLLPTYNSPLRWLARCLDSVLGQTYPHWQLCIADDASTTADVRTLLEGYRKRDERISICYREHNGHISAASNSALTLVTAPWVALLDHDDELPPWALAEVALEIMAHPQAVIVYSDEDKIDEQGRRFDPYFKPDWNSRLMCAQNAVSHLGVYRTEAMRAVGAFRTGYEGAQDWDLALRIAERATPDEIRHIPRILYHWRTVAGSTATAMEGKSYAATAQERVVEEHWARRGRAVVIKRVAQGAFLQCDPMESAVPSISLIVLRRPHVSRDAVEARWKARFGEARWETLVVDLSAADDEAPGVDERALRLGRAGARAVDDAAREARHDVLILIDASLQPDTEEGIELLARHAMQADMGAVGALQVDSQRWIAGAGFVLDPRHIAVSPFVAEGEGYIGMGGRGVLVQNVAAVRLDGAAVRRDVWHLSGGLDAEHLDATFHDVDLCLRMAARGLRSVIHPGVVLAHPIPLRAGAGQVELTRPADAADVASMRVRWGALLARDPAYNPNLASPPRLHEIDARA